MLQWLVACLYCKFYYLFVQYVIPVNCFKKYMFHDFLCIIWTTSKTEKETWQHSQWSFEIKKKKRFSRNPSRTNSTEMHQWLNSVFHFPEFKEQKSHRWIIFANHFWTSQSECAKNTIQLLLWSLFWPLCRAFFEESREDTSCIISNSRWKLYVLLLTENGPFKIMKDI